MRRIDQRQINPIIDRFVIILMFQIRKAATKTTTTAAAAAAAAKE